MNKHCSKHDIDYYIGCNECDAGLALKAEERKHVFTHNPVKVGDTTTYYGETWQVYEIREQWVGIKSSTGGVLNGIHWANLSYSSDVAARALELGAQDLMTWLMKNEFFERTQAENVLQRYLNNKNRDRLGLPPTKGNNNG